MQGWGFSKVDSLLIICQPVTQKSVPIAMKIKKYKKGLGFNKVYLWPLNVMAGTNKVRTYKEWTDLLDGELGKQIGIEW